MRLFFSHLLVFSLLLLACSGEDSKQTADSKPKDPRQKTYLKYCMSCHGASGTMGFSGSADLTTSAMSREDVITMIKKGKNAMIGLEGVMTEQEIQDVAAYVETMRVK